MMMTTATTTSTTSNLNISTAGTSASNVYTYTINTPTWNDWVIDTSSISNSLEICGKSIQDYVKEICENELKGDKSKMTDKFKFGPIKDGTVAFSMRGIAVKNSSGEWVCYDEKTDEIVSVEGMTMDCGGMIFAMPVALKDVQLGDLIIHNKHYCYVMDGDENVLSVIDINDGSIKDIMPTKSPFGFNFITKVTSLMNAGKPSEDSPFGDNFMMYMMMMNGEIDKKMLPFLMMQNKGQIDPMMLMVLFAK